AANQRSPTRRECYPDVANVAWELLFCMAMRAQLVAMEGEDISAAVSGRWQGCVSVIVPVYNEAAHLDQLLQSIHASPVKKEIIIVDDGSTDGTREKLKSMPLADEVTVLFHETNCGKGAAIRTALEYARGEYILIQDSDLEYDPQDYPALLRPLEQNQANVVYGVRPDRPERGLRFLLAAKLCRMGEKIAEVPISYTPRSAGEGKKIRHSDGWLAIWTLFRYRFMVRERWRKSRAPAAPFPVSFSRLPPEPR